MGCARNSLSNCQAKSLTPEQEGQLGKAKQEIYGRLRYILLVLLTSSIISIACGTVLISLGRAGGFPLTACSPVWSGVIMLAAAVLGLLGCSTDPKEMRTENISKQDYYMNSFSKILTMMCFLMGLSLGFEIYTLVVCAKGDEKKCPDYPDVLLPMQITSLLMKPIFITCIIMAFKGLKHLKQMWKQFNDMS